MLVFAQKAMVTKYNKKTQYGAVPTFVNLLSWMDVFERIGHRLPHVKVKRSRICIVLPSRERFWLRWRVLAKAKHPTHIISIFPRARHSEVPDGSVGRVPLACPK